MNTLIRFLLNAVAVMAAAYVVPGISIQNFWAALVAAIVIGILNALVRPLLILLTLPVTILTLGLFTLVINALLFWIAATLVSGFTVAGFWAAFWGALVFWLVSWFTSAVFTKES
ncbi:phage holin family protein [Candidatus Uhrbacteria bacterium]|nr:phage holin family protein [Candidatus Uhrbacteria bacterium]